MPTSWSVVLAKQGKTWHVIKTVWGIWVLWLHPAWGGNMDPRSNTNEMGVSPRSASNTWSIAHGIKHGTSDLSPNIWGKELENEGAAWMAAKWHFPMLSLTRIKSQSQVPYETVSSRVLESKSRFGLCDCDLSWNSGDIPIKCSTNKVKVTEDEGLFGLETDGNNVFCGWLGICVSLLDLEVVFEQKLFVVWSVVNLRSFPNNECHLSAEQPRGHQRHPATTYWKSEQAYGTNYPIYFVNMNGIICPRCMLSLLGPLPVYR